MTYIGNGLVFIASKFGDSQLIRLKDTPDENNCYIEIIKTIPSTGPISDMAVVDLGKKVGFCFPVDENLFLNLLSLPIECSFIRIDSISKPIFVCFKGKSDLITCAGSLKHGSLKIFRREYKITNIMTLSFPSVMEMWPFHVGPRSDAEMEEDHNCFATSEFGDITR